MIKLLLLFAIPVVNFCEYTPATAQTSGTWTATGSMNIARMYTTATLLNNGKVLVAGGLDASNNATASAELYDIATGTWTLTGSMNTPRMSPSATLLPDGKVLIAGGYTTTAVSSAELYDPATGAWTLTGDMNTPRVAHVATLIEAGTLSGKVLVAGGSSICQGCTPVLNSSEIYDPATGLWVYTGSMAVERYWDTRSLAKLPDSTILVVGGVDCCPYHWINEAEIYDPLSETWTATSNKTTPAKDRPILLPDGKVLVAGGSKGTQPNVDNVSKAELFDPATGTWTATGNMSIDRAGQTLTLLPGGLVLVAGGISGGWADCTALISSELYDPATGTWSLTGDMTVTRESHTATLLPNGKVLAAGGKNTASNCSGYALSSAELYTSYGIASLASSDSAICEKFCVDFTDQSTNNPTSWQWIFSGGIPATSIDQNPSNICYNNPGSYDVTLITTNAFGSDTLTLPNYITVNATPPFPVITQFAYTLISSPAFSYQWQFNSSDIPGATNQVYNALQTGYYTLIIADTNGCVNSASVYVLIDGISDVAGDSNFSIYPNPTEDVATLQFTLPHSSQVSVSVYDVSGKEIAKLLDDRVEQGSHSLLLNTNHFSRGVYTVEMISDFGIQNQKLIVQ